MKRVLQYLAVIAFGLLAMRSCSIKRDLRARGIVTPAKVNYFTGIRSGVSVNFTYQVNGKNYTRTGSISGRTVAGLDSIYVKYLPGDPEGHIELFVSKQEINSPLYNF